MNVILLFKKIIEKKFLFDVLVLWEVYGIIYFVLE